MLAQIVTLFILAAFLVCSVACYRFRIDSFAMSNLPVDHE
ncbi:hypothetical protein JCM19238_3156 [Vibrio ponticus]|nr:hypothetical protein JCM19238_3156 [Vibrio ponticus]